MAHALCMPDKKGKGTDTLIYEGSTESHEQQFFVK